MEKDFEKLDKLDKVEEVVEQTNVSFTKAKKYLEILDWNVEQTIKTIEMEKYDSFKEKQKELKRKIKELIKKGNVSRIVVLNKEKDIVLDVPLNAGIVGLAIAPVAMIVACVSALGFNCDIQFVKTNKEVIHISEKFTDCCDKVTDCYNKACEKINHEHKEQTPSKKSNTEEEKDINNPDN